MTELCARCGGQRRSGVACHDCQRNLVAETPNATRPERLFEAELARAAQALSGYTQKEAMFGRVWNWIRGRSGNPPAPRPTGQLPSQPVSAGHPYRAGPARSEIQRQLHETQQPVAQATVERTRARQALTSARRAFETIRQPRPGAVYDLDRETITLNRLEAAQHRLRQAKTRVDQLQAELQRLQERLATTPEGEAMLRRARGRPRVPRSVALVTLYHYSPRVLRTTIAAGSFWTDFGGRNPQDIARITGRNPADLRYRYALRLARSDRDRLFRNMATVMRPGLPAADEYRNLQAIPIGWIQSIQPIQ
jgi:hypothetical protein